MLYLLPVISSIYILIDRDRDRFLDIAQIRSIDGQRVLGLVGTLEDNYWQQIQEALAIVCGLD